MTEVATVMHALFGSEVQYFLRMLERCFDVGRTRQPIVEPIFRNIQQGLAH